MRRVLTFLRQRRADILIVLAIGSFLTVLGPYGATEAMPLVWSWVYWTGLIAWGWAAARLASPLLERILPESTPVWLRALAVSLIVAALIEPVIIAVQHLSGSPVPVSFWPVLYFFVWVITAAMTALGFLIDHVRQGPAAGATGPARALLDKLPARLKQAQIHAFQSEDHYLRVRTDRGEALILMRLADAVAAMEGVDGAQTHRSWWVARAAIADAETGGGRATLILKDGARAPVSRANYGPLKAAGWF